MVQPPFQKEGREMKKQLSIRTMTSAAVLSAVAFVLAFFEFPVPLSPSFARMDFSDFPALIGAFAFGPIAGILIELVKTCWDCSPQLQAELESLPIS